MTATVGAGGHHLSIVLWLNMEDVPSSWKYSSLVYSNVQLGSFMSGYENKCRDSAPPLNIVLAKDRVEHLASPLTGFFSSKMLHVEPVDTPAKRLCREEHERIHRETVKKHPPFTPPN